MGKKATGKLLRKLKTGPKDAAKLKRGKGDTLSTKLNRQQKRMKQQSHKRKRGNNNDNDSSDDEEDEELETRRAQKNWISDPSLAVGEEDDFDPETASKRNSSQKQDNKNKNVMNIDQFLAGGFMDLETDEEDEEENNAEAPEDEEEEEDENSNNDPDEKILSEEENEEDEDSESEDEADDMKQHKKDLEALMERDPEFYKHLKENATDLLQFGEGESDSEEEMEEKDTKNRDSKSNESGVERPLLNGAKLREICNDALVRKTDKGMRSLLGAFRSGCHIADPEGFQHEESVGMGQRYDIVSSAVYQRLMTLTLRDMHKLFAYKLGFKRSKSADGESYEIPAPTSSKQWKRYNQNVKSFVLNLVHLLSQSTEPSMLRFLLQSARHYASYVVALPRVHAKKYLKVLLEHWGASEDSGVRLAAFLRIRQLATIYVKNGDETMLELCLKSTYLCFVKGAKFSTERTIERISTQARCLVELFGLQLNVAYRLGFVYIRQLALHLKSAISSKTVEGIKGVYSWQYVHCLRVWSSILCAYPGLSLKDASDAANAGPQANEELRPLIYPLVQVIIGTVRLVPTPRNFPVRLHCLNMLVPLARAARMYVPVAPLALEILQHSDLYRSKPVASTAKPPDFEHLLRLSEAILPTNQCLDGLVSRAVHVLKEHLDCNRFSIGFPELAFPTLVALRACAKKCRVTRWRSQIRGLVDTINKWSKEVQQKRATVEFSPSDVKRMNHFMRQEEDAQNLVREKEAAGLTRDLVSMIAQDSKVVEQDSSDEEEDDVNMEEGEETDEEFEDDEEAVVDNSNDTGDDVVESMNLEDFSSDSEGE